jgi:hypothetical protein
VGATITIQIGELRAHPNVAVADRSPFLITLRRAGRELEAASSGLSWSDGGGGGSVRGFESGVLGRARGTVLFNEALSLRATFYRKLGSRSGSEGLGGGKMQAAKEFQDKVYLLQVSSH